MQAPFAKKMSIERKEIDDFIVDLAEIKKDGIISYEDVIEAAKKKWSLDSKDLKNIDSYDREIQVVGVKDKW